MPLARTCVYTLAALVHMMVSPFLILAQHIYIIDIQLVNMSFGIIILFSSLGCLTINLRMSWIPKRVRWCQGRYGVCRKCDAHTPGSWRLCPECDTWCGAGCVPQMCWAGDDVNCCSMCLPRKYAARTHALMVLRETSVDANVLHRIYRFIG